MTPALVSSRLVPQMLRQLRTLGRSTAALEKRFGLDPGAAEAASVKLALAQIDLFSRHAAALAGDEDFGLHLAESMPRGEYGLLEFAVRSAPTVRDGLRVMVERLGLPGEPVRFELRPYPEGLEFHLLIEGLPQGYGRHCNEQAVAALFRVGREVVSAPLRPERVWFSHSAPERVDELRRFFQTSSLSFDQRTSGAALSEATLRLPIHAVDPALHRTLLEELPLRQSEPATDGLPQVRKVLAELLGQRGAEVSVERVARRLGLSERTLQRQLATHGVSFRALLVDTRRALAEGYLRQTSMTVKEISERLGFFDARSFTRAFQQWVGVTPLAFRGGAKR